jgi:tRNA pseudouridine55 synthase
VQQLHGLLLVRKPEGLSSFDVLRHLKRVLSSGVKIGHAGTLDPFATGLLIVCLGRGTKLVPLLSDVTKGYRVTAQFGQLTDTLDKTGSVIAQQSVPVDLEEQVSMAVAQLGTAYKQTPPVFSALKHEGRTLYALARYYDIEQQALEDLAKSKSRWVWIGRLDVAHVQGALVTFDCEVSKGAYIRSLADDLAQKIGLRATTHALERAFIGPFQLDQAYTLDQLNSPVDVEKYLIDVEKARVLLVS